MASIDAGPRADPTRILDDCERALARAPHDATPLLAAARALREAGSAAPALACLERALTLTPRTAAAALHHDRGLLLQRLGRLDEAALALAEAIAIAPAAATTHAALGSVHRAAGAPVAALECLRRAVALAPGDAAALNNLGLTLRDLGDLEGAIGAYRAAISAAPDRHRPYYNLAMALREQRRLPQALDAARAALERRPRYPLAAAEALRDSLELGDWSDLEPLRRAVLDGAEAGEVLSPFGMLAVADDPGLQCAVARRYAASLAAPAPGSLPRAARGADGRWRVAYVSADFHSHATSYLLAELLELHDRSRFVVIGVSTGPDDGSALRGRVARACDEFVEARGRSDREVVAWLRARGTAIAVDLKGYTQGARPGIFARRAAPVQVSYLGYPGTSGAAHVDYLVVDPYLVPPESRPHYTESLLYLPDCYQPNDRARRVDAAAVTRTDCDLPEQGVVYCCFNNAWKLTPELFAAWMRVLDAVPDSVLWLLAGNPWQPAQLQAEAARAGIDPRRLRFAPRVAVERHLARHRLADLALDTLPCNAHTTASDALWSGVPLLTLTGRTFAGRVAGSVLRAAGLGSLICASLSEYERIAIELGTDRVRLAALRRALDGDRTRLPLFDTGRYRIALESAWLAIAARAERGEPPADWPAAQPDIGSR